MVTNIRPLRAEDFPDVGRIFFCAIHEGTRHVYTLDQRRAWAGDTVNLAGWKDRVKDLSGFIAEEGGEAVGFMTIDQTGYVDLAFVLPSAAGRGIGGALLMAAEDWAARNSADRLTTAASLAARPFFEKRGWCVVKEEEVDRQGVALTRFQMHKTIVRDDEQGSSTASGPS